MLEKVKDTSVVLPGMSWSHIGRPSRLEDWLPRPDGEEVTEAVATGWLEKLVESKEALAATTVKFARIEGVASHRQGTLLNELHDHRAWAPLGCAGFVALVEERVSMPTSTAYDLMFFARAVPAADAVWGVEKALAGCALAHVLGVDGIAALWNSQPSSRWQEDPAWAEMLGEEVGFEASTAKRLRGLVLRVAERTLPLEGRTERAKKEAARRQEIIERHAAKSPALRRLEPYAYAYGRDAPVKHKPPRTREEFEVVAAMYRALARA